MPALKPSILISRPSSERTNDTLFVTNITPVWGCVGLQSKPKCSVVSALSHLHLKSNIVLTLKSGSGGLSGSCLSGITIIKRSELAA